MTANRAEGFADRLARIERLFPHVVRELRHDGHTDQELVALLDDLLIRYVDNCA
jgi:hypothetical protein